MKSAYPTFIAQDGKDFLVYVPDLDIYTEGTSFTDAIDMARDAIGLKGMDDNHLPEPSSYAEAMDKAKADADEDFDFSTGTLTFVDVDFAAYRRKHDTRTVKKNCTLPCWLNEAATEAKLNFSQVLQEALIQKLNIHVS